jgi:hypothetical protein
VSFVLASETTYTDNKNTRKNNPYIPINSIQKQPEKHIITDSYIEAFFSINKNVYPSILQDAF